MRDRSSGRSRWDFEVALFVAFLVALVVWFVAAGEAHGRTIGFTHYVVVPLAMLGVGALAFVRSAQRGRRRFVDGAVSAAVGGMIAWVAAAGLNVWLDPSPPVERRGRVIAVYSPSKGPRMLRVRLGASEVTFLRELAPECAGGHPIVVVVRPGALGGEWVERARCGEAP